MWPFENKKKDKDKVEGSNYLSAQKPTEVIEIEKMANKLIDILHHTSKEIIFLCVGSDRSTGDSLGPIVGTLLKEKNIPFPIYGTLQAPVHALNIKNVIEDIHNTFEDPFIIGIDACLGDERKIGTIFIREGSFFPGKALNKELPSVGDCHITANVNYLDPFYPMQSLSSTRLYTVLKIADIMTKIIIRSVFLIRNSQ
ncbi:spore protease YyaC [Bacillus sp. EB600]|uniref:spore protease YyaC n=1 Tax=Bacillus sp. EB600 TaxID=2806345 RepID=UPI00210D2208|nr:spore protease YyaC [Bacillus sp. EB600]MCQ6279410.1 spore protease YyaC [Bacillus sp. EB600]